MSFKSFSLVPVIIQLLPTPASGLEEHRSPPAALSQVVIWMDENEVGIRGGEGALDYTFFFHMDHLELCIVLRLFCAACN